MSAYGRWICARRLNFRVEPIDDNIDAFALVWNVAGRRNKERHICSDIAHT
jgi:hypothetical protein